MAATELGRVHPLKFTSMEVCGSVSSQICSGEGGGEVESLAS